MSARLVGLVRTVFRRAPREGDAAERRRWHRGVLAGGLPALVLQVWMLTAGTWNLLRWERTADFYDGQARAILKGALAMDSRVLGIESFNRGANAYMYFGPVPAAYRLPFVAVTDRLDGRLGVLSMLVAFVVVLLVVGRLGWRLRHLVLGDAPVTRGEQAGTAGLVFVIVGGSSLLFASSRTWVYHEAILWGVAYTLASYSCLLLFLHHGARRFVAWASLFATLALMTRASVGGGAVAGLAIVWGCVVAGRLAQRWQARPRVSSALGRLDWVPAGSTHRRIGSTLVAATAVPVVSYATVNYIKFHTFFSVPFGQQQFSILDERRREMLAANGGSLFNWKFLPSNLVQYWRPDMLSLSGRFPFISFPQRPMLLIGHPFYDLTDLTAGIPATMPLLVVLAVVGTVAIVRERRFRLLRPVLLACVAGTVTVLNIGYIANRYQSDFLPLLVVPALVGAPLVVRWLRAHQGIVRRAAVGLVVTAGSFGVLANLALGYAYQRAYAPVTPPNQIAGFIRMQLTVDDWLGDGRLPRVTQGPELPERGNFGDIFILGDCRAVYWADGMATNAVKRSNWNGVERADGDGAFVARISFPRPAAPSTQPLFTTSGGDGGATVFVLIDPDIDRMQFGYTGPDGGWSGAPVQLPYDTELRMRVVMDPRVGIFEMYVDGRLVLATGYTSGVDVELGRNTYHNGLIGEDRFLGTIERVPTDMPLCRDLLASVAP
jgi:hypothetical protein